MEPNRERRATEDESNMEEGYCTVMGIVLDVEPDSRWYRGCPTDSQEQGSVVDSEGEFIDYNCRH